MLDTIGGAQVVLIGAGRTSKTLTCVYLAIRGVRVETFRWCPAFSFPLRCWPWAFDGSGHLGQVGSGTPQPSDVMGEVRDRTMLISIGRNEVSATRKLFEQHGGR